MEAKLMAGSSLYFEKSKNFLLHIFQNFKQFISLKLENWPHQTWFIAAGKLCLVSMKNQCFMESLKSSNGITFFSSPSVVYKQNAHNISYNL